MLLGKPQRDRFEVYNDKNKNLVNLFMVIRERPAALIQELGYHHLNSRDDFKVYKKAIQKEEFTSEYMDEEMELTYRLFSRPQADEIRDIYLRQAEEYDVHRAAMFFLLSSSSRLSAAEAALHSAMKTTLTAPPHIIPRINLIMIVHHPLMAVSNMLILTFCPVYALSPDHPLAR